MSGATLVRLQLPDSGDAYLKIASARIWRSCGPRSNARRGWLAVASGARLLRVFDDGATAAVMMTALAGAHPGDARQPVGDIVRAVARGLAGLHALPAHDCPFDETVASRLAQAREMMKRGLVAPEHFADRNRGLAPEDIYDR